MVPGMRVRRTTVRRCRASATGLAEATAAVVWRCRDPPKDVAHRDREAAMEWQVARPKELPRGDGIAVMVGHHREL
jgi:hypothetical protein